ncbi:MAG: hypothetical protein CVV47_00645 [Spirochaetae bacterium HGW-Spirochaetae-3]|nr:MAG: hypothetical protein CVV47_00645 [Spirochaetae bacterium HGW-Spirochaetae-3]
MNRSLETFLNAARGALNVALQPRILWSAILSVVFLTSAISLMTVHRQSAVVVWFPDSRSEGRAKARPEIRYVRYSRDVASQASAVVEEILLGPLDASSRPICVPTATVRSVIRSKKTLYVDIAGSMLFGRVSASGIYEAPPLEPRVALGYIERALRYNFSFFSIVLTVDGLEPAWRPREVPIGA